MVALLRYLPSDLPVRRLPSWWRPDAVSVHQVVQGRATNAEQLSSWRPSASQSARATLATANKTTSSSNSKMNAIVDTS